MTSPLMALQPLWLPVLSHRGDPCPHDPTGQRSGCAGTELRTSPESEALPGGQAACGSWGKFWDLGIYTLIFTLSSSPWIFLCCSPQGCEVICYI